MILEIEKPGRNKCAFPLIKIKGFSYVEISIDSRRNVPDGP